MNNVCITGFGRLGETLAGIVQDRLDVGVIEPDPERAARALELGCKVVGLEAAAEYDANIVCVPISQFEGVVQELAPHLAPGSTLMDACSVKVFPARVMAETVPEGVSVIATHPLFGPDSVGRGLDTLTMVTSPVRAAPKRFSQWDEFWKSYGLNVINATPEEHDHVSAYTLGMTHFFGRIMDELHLEPQVITTVGYSALYEVMRQTNRDSWQLFRDMQHYNPFAPEMRARVFAAIETVERKLNEALDETE
jgi:prephenate dehydrogenase